MEDIIMSEEKEVVKIELVFGDGSEEIELSKDEFLMIQMHALHDNMTFEEKFIQILQEYIDKEDNNTNSRF
jgi:hypothetical protein